MTRQRKYWWGFAFLLGGLALGARWWSPDAVTTTTPATSRTAAPARTGDRLPRLPDVAASTGEATTGAIAHSSTIPEDVWRRAHLVYIWDTDSSPPPDNLPVPTIDRSYSELSDRGYDHREHFFELFDRFVRESGLPENRRRAMLLAIYDYQEQRFALNEELQKARRAALDREERLYGTTARRDDETREEYARRQEETDRIYSAATAWRGPMREQLKKELLKGLRRALGPELYFDWLDLCDEAALCIENALMFEEFDLISFPGSVHLHTCEELDACYEQRQPAE